GLTVTLQASAGSNLNEVVVVGYGTQRKRDVTATIAKIGAEKIANVPAPSFESALAGKAAGVQVNTTGGLAGSGAVVRIRGINSISIAGDPLYVIDGIPIDVTYVGGPSRNNLGQDRNPLANLNPNDIESVEILKDAGATGIYGSRGANGVILITTKRGKGRMHHNFSSRVGMSGPSVKPDFVDAKTWLAIRQEAWEMDGNTGVQQNLPGGLGGYPLEQALNGTNTDWWDQATRTGISQEYNYSVSRGIGNFNFYAAGNYGKEQSYIVGNDFQRAGVRANMDYKVRKNLSVALNSAFYSGINNMLNNGWNGGLGMAMSTGLPYYPVYNADGSYFRTGDYRLTWGTTPGAPYTIPNSNNLVAQREGSDFRSRENRIIGTLSGRYTPVKNLDISASASFEQNKSLYNSYYTPWMLNRSTGAQGAAENNLSTYRNQNYNLTANYAWDVTSNSRFTFLLGTEYQEQKTLNEYARLDSAAGELYKIDKTAKIDSIIGAAPSNTTFERLFRSVFARVNYSFRSKYILQASIRRDESSAFRDNYKTAWFPTVSGAWLLSEEDFFRNALPQVNLLKLRASWGLVGTSNLPWDASYASFDTARRPQDYYNGQPTIFRTRLGNPDLRWETASNIDLALEAGLFNNRVSIEAAYYRRKNTDILIEVPISSYNGVGGSQWQNQGSILNEGVEF
ncbi:MAG TPA: SusC/RagA family TonB-linked outer membrane protein, partial [Chitinophagaceae bacterium]|nr:SusC/RagA family TonB-linked outer membrane protein [Chitinophagaceae bacterium]